MCQTRQQVITASEREYRDNPACRRMATAREWVNGALRESNHDKLTASEAMLIPDQRAEQEREKHLAIEHALRPVDSPDRASVIAESEREYNDNVEICRKMGTVHSWVNAALRDAGLTGLSDDEILTIKRKVAV